MRKGNTIAGLLFLVALVFCMNKVPAMAAENEQTLLPVAEENAAEETGMEELKKAAESINEMLRGEDYDHLTEEEIDTLAETMFAEVVEDALENGMTVEEETASETGSKTWDGPVLTEEGGINYGPSGKESYYNLNMSRIITLMKDLGHAGEYWVREDGCKMFGDYIMCAANLDVRPRGTLVESSLGTCIVCDTGSFAHGNPTMLDIAVTW